MKSKVRYSKGASTLTILVTGLILAICIASAGNPPALLTVAAVFLVLIVSALMYGAVYLRTTDTDIILGSPLKKRRIPLSNVASVELFRPTMGAVRVLGSGGFMGYWGIFKEGDIGRYYAFYGKASDCFLVRMKNGDKYVLGCENPGEMMDYIISLTDSLRSDRKIS